MKTRIPRWLAAVVPLLLLFVLPGCYTQLGSTREEWQGKGYTSDEQKNDEQGNAEYADDHREDGTQPGYDDDAWDSRPRIGFSYYYPSTYWPSVTFGMAYADPWSYDYCWSCGSWGWRSPFWYPTYGYYSSYYSPYSYGYWSGYPYYWTNNSLKPLRRGSRDFGSTRQVEAGRPGGGQTDVRYNGGSDAGARTLPTGGVMTRSGSTGAVRASGTSSTQGGTRVDGNQRDAGVRESGSRPATARGSGVVRGSRSSGRDDNARVYRRRDAGVERPSSDSGSQPAAPSVNSTPSTHERGKSQGSGSGNRDAGTSRGTPRSAPPSYSPPPQRSAPSSPPPSGGSSGGASRGGSGRGGRP